MWEFENYVVYKETDVLRFENLDGDILGYVSFDDGGEEMTRELNRGIDPIAEGWEDGIGNTISLNGWGDNQI
ncbi:hypothetical protein [Oceanobacillus sp. FSL H7-0719]|uniref:hypothetical protein n=1 Tax=Oceanobacillus sp. FSL H7-0719 TaxID=2954507 RepID=UPI0032513551